MWSKSIRNPSDPPVHVTFIDWIPGICSALGMADEIRRGVPSAATADLTARTIDLDHDEVRERLSGNLCRCGAYNGIVAAVTETFAPGASR